MTRADAIDAMANGKKVRQCCWEKGYYVYLEGDSSLIRDSYGNYYGFWRFSNYLYFTSKNDEWEILETD